MRYRLKYISAFVVTGWVIIGVLGVVSVNKHPMKGNAVVLTADEPSVFTYVKTMNASDYYVRDIALDGNGRMYLADPENGTVLVYDVNGTYIDALGFTAPAAVAVAGDRLFVCESYWDGRLYILDLETYAVINSTPAHVAYDAYDLWVDKQGNIYVPGFNADTIEIYDQTLTLQHTLTDLNYAVGVVTDLEGKIYVCTSGDYYGRLVVFDSEYHRLGSFGGSPSNASPQLMEYPWGVAVTPFGNIVITDAGKDEVQFYSSSWQLREAIPDLDELSGVILDDNNYLYVLHDRVNISVWQIMDLDYVAPSITNIHVVPTSPNSTDYVTISATIHDTSGIFNTSVVYSWSGVNNATMTMTPNDTTYTAVLDPLPANHVITFYVFAQDNSSLKHTSWSGPYQFQVQADPLDPPGGLPILFFGVGGVIAISIGGLAYYLSRPR